MKTTVWCVLISVLTAGIVCAEGPTFSVSLEAVRDALYLRHFTGDYAARTPAIDGSPYLYQGDGEASELKFFQASAFDDPLTLTAKAAYTGERYGGMFQIKVLNNDNNVFNSDWEAWVRLGNHLRLLTGNQAQRGRVAQYQHFHDFLRTKIDNMGVMVPTWQSTPKDGPGNNLDQSEFPYGYGDYDRNKGYAVFAGSEAQDLFIPAGSTGRLSGLTGDVAFEPVTVTLSVGGLYEELSKPFVSPWLKEYKTTEPIYDRQNDLLYTTNATAGIRVEGAEIADMLTVSAVYKYEAATLTKNMDGTDGTKELDEKVNNHAFGVYANIKPAEDWGISIGYSGLYQTWENGAKVKSVVPPSYMEEHYLSSYEEAILPFYNGIDLRAYYSGLEGLRITFNNNVSFANAKGPDDRLTQFAWGWAFQSALNEDNSKARDRTESYLGWYAALGAKYALTDELTILAQVANQLGIFSLAWEWDTIRSLVDYLGAFAGVDYQIMEKARFRATVSAGVSMKWAAYSYQDYISNDLDTHKAGYIDFGIPLGIKVEY
jgi:hypothetical protein